MKILSIVPNRFTVSNRIHAWYTYCNIGVYFVFLPIFTDEPAAEFVHTRRHYLKSLMALREDGLKSFNLLLKGVQTSHLGERTNVPDPKFFGGACSKKIQQPERNTTYPMTARQNGDRNWPIRLVSYNFVLSRHRWQHWNIQTLMTSFRYSWVPLNVLWHLKRNPDNIQLLTKVFVRL